jgi:hypothetical protein
VTASGWLCQKRDLRRSRSRVLTFEHTELVRFLYAEIARFFAGAFIDLACACQEATILR